MVPHHLKTVLWELFLKKSVMQLRISSILTNYQPLSRRLLAMLLSPSFALKSMVPLHAQLKVSVISSAERAQISIWQVLTTRKRAVITHFSFVVPKDLRTCVIISATQEAMTSSMPPSVLFVALPHAARTRVMSHHLETVLWTLCHKTSLSKTRMEVLPARLFKFKLLLLSRVEAQALLPLIHLTLLSLQSNLWTLRRKTSLLKTRLEVPMARLSKFLHLSRAEAQTLLLKILPLSYSTLLPLQSTLHLRCH
mmetsp:Transcript_17677/g.31955  ORF Transcript_17677/g.31955 Transcript_17677/m.31955 type:complete len:252 (+) Transcript_17677:42-797(+)